MSLQSPERKIFLSAGIRVVQEETKFITVKVVTKVYAAASRTAGCSFLEKYKQVSLTIKINSSQLFRTVRL